MMREELIISAYGSHNACVSMYYNGEYKIVELERWLNSKNAGLSFYSPSKHMQLVFDEVCEYLLSQTDGRPVDVYISGYMGSITPKFQYNKAVVCDHHMSHAAGAFYQSPYEDALVFTYDGGGDGGFFNVYKASKTGDIELLSKFNQDLGFAYMILADYLKDIKRESLSIGNLVYSGKLMGLCSYGAVRTEWLDAFDEFYSTFNYTGDSFLGGAEARYVALPKLFKDIGINDFDIEHSSFEGPLAWDIAATTQRAFELQFLKYANPYIEMYSELPLVLSGGCALNVLLNTKLLEIKNGNVFVPPNTNDCGISIGSLLWYQKPKNIVDLTYSGLPIMDDNRFSEYVESGNYSVITDVTPKIIAGLVADGKIIGMIQGNSEHGSRALGNRSIICNPVSGMKDTLNHKVKNREWYRPFAPIVRLQDTEKYFNFSGIESRHMVFVADVKDAWKDVLPAITHEDGTARLQTVTREQNPLVYDIITELEPLTGHGVILNTSFNVNGKPILTRLSDAFDILQTSKLDAVYYKNNLIFREGEINETGVSRKADERTDDVGICLLAFSKDKTQLIRNLSKLIPICNETGKRIIIICDIDDVSSLNSFTSKDVVLHGVESHRLYYKKVINLVHPDADTVTELSEWLKPLWVKEAIRDDVNKNGKYIIIDSSKVTDDMLMDDINMLMSAIEVSGDSVVSLASVEQNNRWETPAIAYDGSFYGGHYDGLEWLLTAYEGNLNLKKSLGQECSEADLLALCGMENSERMKPLYL